MMKLPYMQVVKKKYEDEKIEFGQYNNTENHSMKDLYDMKNMCSDKFPIISTRKPRELIRTLTSPHALFSTEDKLCEVDGTNFKYDNVVKGTVTAGPKSMVDFNGKVLIFPDKKYYDYDNNVFGTIATGTYPTDQASVPDIDYAAVLDNRVWGVKGIDVYASKLGDHTKWAAFDALDSDSYATDVADRGDFTGIAKVQGHIVLQKNDMAYEIYGNKPSNFKITDIESIGATNNKGIVVANSRMYYLNTKGIYEYNGGLPNPMSLNIEQKFISAVSGTDLRKIYMSVYNGATYDLFVYDTYFQKWSKEDNLQAIDFARINADLYVLDATGKLYKMNSGTNNAIEYMLETHYFNTAVFNKKRVSSVKIAAYIESGATLDVLFKQDNENFTFTGSYRGNGEMKYIHIPIDSNRCNRFKIKIQGKGYVEIHNIKQTFTIGSDKNG